MRCSDLTSWSLDQGSAWTEIIFSLLWASQLVSNCRACQKSIFQLLGKWVFNASHLHWVIKILASRFQPQSCHNTFYTPHFKQSPCLLVPMQVKTVIHKISTSEEVCSFHLKIETQEIEGKRA